MESERGGAPPARRARARRARGPLVLLAVLALAAAFCSGGQGAAASPEAPSTEEPLRALAQAPVPGRLLAASPARSPARSLTRGAAAGPLLQLARAVYRLQEGHLAGGRVYLQLRGALTAERRRRLEALGVRLGAYVPEQAWEAWVPPAAAPALAGLGFVRAAVPVVAADKLPPALLGGSLPPGVAEGGRLRLEVHFHPDVDLDAALAALAAAGAEPLERAFLSGRRLGALVPEGALGVLAARPEVRWLAPRPHPPRTHNAAAARQVGVAALQEAPFGLDGSGVLLAQWDEGTADASHPDLAGRVEAAEPAPVAAHPTHVAGTLVGSGLGSPEARGMAPGARLLGYDYYGDPPAEHAAARRRGVAVANDSWGYLRGWERDYYGDGRWVWFGQSEPFGAYTALSALWDGLVADTGLTVIKSAGNDRGDTGPAPGAPHHHFGDPAALHTDTHPPDGDYPTLGAIASAKNLVVVGAVDAAGGDSGFSAWGPTRDGRIKPDLVAPGVGLYSTAPGGGYALRSGTSMATPVVAGAAALLVQRHRALRGGEDPPPELLRALLAHTARDLDLPGPDARTGWGLLDAPAAAELLDRDGGTGRRIRRGSLADGELLELPLEVSPGLAELRLTLAWTDPPAAPGTALALVNDLDLALVAPDGTVHHPFRLDLQAPAAPARTDGPNRVDNLEQVRVAAPTPGTWRVRLRGARVQGSQAYVLASSVDLVQDRAPPRLLALEVAEGTYARSRRITLRLEAEDDLAVTGYFVGEEDAPPEAGAFTPVAPEARWSAEVGYTLTPGDGPKRIRAWVRDAAGRIAGPLEAAVILDTQPPEPPVVAVVLGADGLPRWSWTGGGGGSGVFRFKLNDADLEVGAAEGADTAWSPEAPLPAGRHVLYVAERDAAGNWSAPAAAPVELPEPPAPSLPGPSAASPPPPALHAASPVRHGRPLWTWERRGSGLFRYALDPDRLAEAPVTNATAFRPAEPLPDGAHTLYLQELGPRGRWSPRVTATVVVDTTAPHTRAVAEAAAGGVRLRLVCEDAGSGCAATYYTTDGSLPTPASPRYLGPVLLAPGTELRFLSVDRAGNAEPARSHRTPAPDRAAAPLRGDAVGGGAGLWWWLLPALPLLGRRPA